MTRTFRYAYSDFDPPKRKPRWERSGRPMGKRVLAGAVLGLFALSLIMMLSCTIYLAIASSIACLLALFIPGMLLFFVVRGFRRNRHLFGSIEQWRLDPMSSEDFRIAFDDSRFSIACDSWQHFIPWDEISEIWVSRREISIVVQGQGYVIPKRIFLSPEEAAAYSSALEAAWGRRVIREKA